MLSGVKMMTADPLGRAASASLSMNRQQIVIGVVNELTGLGVTHIALREAAESEVETLVDVPDIPLEVLADLGELRESAERNFPRRRDVTLPPFVPAMKILSEGQSRVISLLLVRLNRRSTGPTRRLCRGVAGRTS